MKKFSILFVLALSANALLLAQPLAEYADGVAGSAGVPGNAITISSSGRVESLSSDERMAWWREARFGLFIHWGVYAVLGGVYDGHQIGKAAEWIMNRGKIPVAEYRQVANRFNPVKYDADAWVRLAKEA